MSRTRVKICGITNAEDAAAVAASGADAIGFNFFEGSSRYIDLENACDIAAGLPPYVTTVALVVDESAERIEEIIATLKPDLLQFHGGETPEFCRQFNHPFVKALAVNGAGDLSARVMAYEGAQGVLLDTATESGFGGTGQTFDWTLVPALSMPVILAGGLNAVNVREAIQALKPYAVDVSGGVEKRKGQKDADKIHEFCDAVRQADQEKL